MLYHRPLAAIDRHEETLAAGFKRFHLARCKQVVEPSAAVTLAAVMSDADRFRGKRLACVLSGGNVDLKRLPWVDRV